MISFSARLLSAALFALGASTAFAAPPTHVSYTVEVKDPSSKTFQVTARAEGATDADVGFAIPAWSPGWYVLTHGYQNVVNVSAVSDTGETLSVSHPDKLTWMVARGKANNVTLRYDVKAVDNDADAVGAGAGSEQNYGFFAPYLDDKHGFAPGPATLVYAVGAIQVPCDVRYKVPTGWQIASANDPVAGDSTSFTAPDYDTLADQPAELGTFEREDKIINGVPVGVVLVGNEGKPSARFRAACWKIAEAGMKVFGNPGGSGSAPFPRYIFFFHFPDGMQGIEGLEHKNCTVIRLPVESLDGPDTTALNVTAHEYTHAWNVKRIRSRALGPFDYTQAVRTRDLWWLEGVTDYFAPRLLVEAGLVSPGYWRAYLSEILTSLENNPARTKVTLEDASLKAWEGRSEGFGGLSYYEKGLTVGLLLDVEMRKRSGGKVGLDDVMRELFEQQAKTGRGFADGEIERVASRLTGSDLKPFFDRALRSTEELPFDNLDAAGLRLQKTPLTLPDYGLTSQNLSPVKNGIQIDSVAADSPLAQAGGRTGDVITQVDGKPVMEVIGGLMGYAKSGDTVALTVLRQGETRTLSIAVGKRDMTIYSLATLPSATAAQKAILDRISGAAGRAESH